MIENEVRRALRDLADEGHPVDLGRTALSGARRRRRARIRNAATTVAAAVSVAAVVIPMQLVNSGGGEPEPAGGPGPYVVTTYEVNGTPMVLNPRTGEYTPAPVAYARCPLPLDCAGPGDYDRSPVAVSADLRWFASVQSLRDGDMLLVAPTDPGTARMKPTFLPDGSRATNASWSPDGKRIALWGAEPDGASERLGTVVMAEPSTGESSEVPLQLPAGRTALAPVAWGLAWLDSEHLVIPTTDSERRVALPREGEDGRWVVTGLTIIDTNGVVVREVPIHQDDDLPHAGRIWLPYGPVRDGRVLLVRTPEPATLELAVMDLDADPGPPPDPVSVSIPPVELRPEAGRELRPNEASGLGGAVWHDAASPGGRFYPALTPKAWLGDGFVLAESVAYGWEGGFTVPRRHYLIDLRSGELEQVGLPVSESWGWDMFAETELLSPSAARRAATF